MNSLFKITLATLLLSVIPQNLQANTFKTERWQTTQGAHVVFSQAMEVPMLTIGIAFAAGSAYDNEQFGLSALTTNLLSQGNGGLNATKIAEKLADTGAQYSAGTSRDMAIFSLKTLTNKEALKQAVDTFSLIINKPDFPINAFHQEKKQQLMTIIQEQESPEEIASQVFFKTLYQNHPYAHSINGTKERINTIQREQVKAFYNRYFVGKNMVIVLVGAISSTQAHQIAEQLTQHLSKGQAASPIPKAKPLESSAKIAVNFPSSQTVLQLGQVGINHHASNYFPLMVGNYILGGGALVSRLAHEVREKRGLTYSIVSQFMPMPGDGPFLISFSTQNKQAALALQVTEDTLSRFVTQGLDEQELIAAKQYLIGNFPMSLAGNENKASTLLRMAFYQLPDDYLQTYRDRINSVTTTEIQNAFHKQLDQDKMLFVSVGKK